MAVESPTGPDCGAMLALINASKVTDGSGCAPIMLGARLETQITCFKLPAGLFNAEGMVNKLPQCRPGMVAKLCESMGLKGAQIVADIGKCAQGAGVMYSGTITNGAPVSSNAPVSGGYDGPALG